MGPYGEWKQVSFAAKKKKLQVLVRRKDEEGKAKLYMLQSKEKEQDKDHKDNRQRAHLYHLEPPADY